VAEDLRPGADPGRGDGAALVAARALAGDDPTCVEALELFTACLGAAAGDLALTVRAEGGVRLAGGIAPRILDALRSGPFLAAFRDKGRFAPFLERVPVHVVTNDRVGLLGAASCAAGCRCGEGG
jgi:glucokinase